MFNELMEKLEKLGYELWYDTHTNILELYKDSTQTHDLLIDIYDNDGYAIEREIPYKELEAMATEITTINIREYENGRTLIKETILGNPYIENVLNEID